MECNVHSIKSHQLWHYFSSILIFHMIADNMRFQLPKCQYFYRKCFCHHFDRPQTRQLRNMSQRNVTTAPFLLAQKNSCRVTAVAYPSIALIICLSKTTRDRACFHFWATTENLPTSSRSISMKTYLTVRFSEYSLCTSAFKFWIQSSPS